MKDRTFCACGVIIVASKTKCGRCAKRDQLDASNLANRRAREKRKNPEITAVSMPAPLVEAGEKLMQELTAKK